MRQGIRTKTWYKKTKSVYKFVRGGRFTYILIDCSCSLCTRTSSLNILWFFKIFFAMCILFLKSCTKNHGEEMTKNDDLWIQLIYISWRAPRSQIVWDGQGIDCIAQHHYDQHPGESIKKQTMLLMREKYDAKAKGNEEEMKCWMYFCVLPPKVVQQRVGTCHR